VRPVTTGIVLAGGRSARFGSADGFSKLDADLAGRTVLDRTIDAVATTCDEILVVGRLDGPRADVRYLADEAAFEGPLVALAAGLELARADMAVVVGGDMPLLESALIGLLVDRLRSSPAIDAVVLDDTIEPRPLPVALRRDAGAEAVRRVLEAGGRSMRALVAALSTAAIPPSDWRAIDPNADWTLDIDRPEDLAAARRLVAR